jgi:hypothetical protein
MCAPSTNVSHPCDVVDLLMQHDRAERLRNHCGAIDARIVDEDQLHTAPAHRDTVAQPGQCFR